MSNFALNYRLTNSMSLYYRLLSLAIIISVCTLPLRAKPTMERTMVHYADQPDLSTSRVDGAVQDERGLMWFATWNGLDCFDGYNFHWVKMQPGDGACVENDRIREIELSPEGNILCFTNDEVFEFNLSTYRFKSLPKSKQIQLLKQKGHVSEEQWSGMIDNQGNYWTADINGIYKYTYKHHPAQLVGETAGQHMRAFMIDRKKRLWAGSRREMLLRVWGADGSKLHESNLGYMIFIIQQIRSGYIWIGTKAHTSSNAPSKLLKVNPETYAVEKELDISDVYDIQQDKYGRLWLASFTKGVVCCPNPDAPNPTLTKSYGGKRVRKIHITPNGNIIAATGRGLLVGNVNDKDVGRIKLRPVQRDGNNISSLATNSTIDIEQDKLGNIFIGTANSGIDMITEQSLMSDAPEFKHFSVATSSIMSDFCSALTFFNNNTLMVVSNTSVMLFNPYKDNTVNYNSVFFCDSCRMSEGKPVLLPDGHWLFGTERGAYKVSLKDMVSREFIPPLTWSYVEVNGGAEDYSRILNDTLCLETDERNIRIGFAAIDYVDNTGILYRTRLDESPWTYDSSERSISLFDMEPGTYTLQVQSTDRFGRWVDNVKTLRIIVKPYWYETMWAKIILLLVLLAIAAAMYFNFRYIKRLRKQRQETLEKYMLMLSRHEENDDDDDISPKQKHEASLIMRQIEDEDQIFLDKIRLFIEKNIANSDITIDDMADIAATSRSTLNRRLRSLLGITAAQLLIDARMQHAVELLKKSPDLTITDMAFQCGYSDPRYFSRSFKLKYGVSPSEYKGDITDTATD